MAKGPVLIEDDASDPSNPADAPPVLDVSPAPTGAAMHTIAAMARPRKSILGRWFLGLLLAVIGFFVSLAAWNTVTALLSTNPILGYVATGLLAAFLLVLLAIAIREASAFARLRRIDGLQEAARAAHQTEDLGAARAVTARITRLYAGREDTSWGRQALAEREAEVFDASGLLDLAERSILDPLDQAAVKEVEAAARQVATVTALVPIALADVVTALTANLRMIRRIAEIYGGRSGVLGGWRLTRSVLSHLVATGALAVGDDLLGSVAGGSILGKLSRRFGEGMINGALTVRVGIAAMEVCRPMPFAAVDRPSVSSTITRSLTGLFSKGD